MPVDELFSSRKPADSGVLILLRQKLRRKMDKYRTKGFIRLVKMFLAAGINQVALLTTAW